ncbi:MAG TPA: OmpA family protein [Steroidobacteraceae bacterium]|nr:OmpA family protein [Steroidobacteraceae bacterium]
MATAILVQRHPIVWRDPPVWPFLWRGLVPLAALAAVTLYALGPFARNAIQVPIEQELRAQLDAAGFTWVRLSVSGQRVKLTGLEPSSGDGARALALARGASCPTWLGRHTCAGSVSGDFEPAPAVATPAPVAAPVSAPVTAPAHPTLAAAPLTREGCDHAFASLLASEQIEFAPGSAKIDPKSGPLLDRLAHQIKTCPGKIRIEGYTDTVGRGRLNQRLSEARATAVRSALIARGVTGERLSAKGYGARRAIADNTTEAGRARNRRIELHTVSRQ